MREDAFRKGLLVSYRYMLNTTAQVRMHVKLCQK